MKAIELKKYIKNISKINTNSQLIALLRQAWSSLDEIEKQRDELLEACKKIYAERVNIGLNKSFWTPGITEILKQAIAKAKGEIKC